MERKAIYSLICIFDFYSVEQLTAFTNKISIQVFIASYTSHKLIDDIGRVFIIIYFYDFYDSFMIQVLINLTI